jgi:hypothetical protein
VLARHALRAAAPGRGEGPEARRRAARTAIRTLLGRADPPFGQPPDTSVAPLVRR